MPYPVWTAGQRQTAALLSAMQPIVVAMSADQSVTNSTTLTNVTELTFPMAASAKYEVTAIIYASGSTTGDLQTNWTVPTGATGLKGCWGPTSGSTDRTNTSMRSGAHGLTTAVAYGTSSTSAGIACIERALVTTSSSGTWQMQFAQNTVDASNATRLFTGSYVIARRVA